jgi:prepilin-type N-terminal cleavage/methylation domain-containing protein
MKTISIKRKEPRMNGDKVNRPGTIVNRQDAKNAKKVVKKSSWRLGGSKPCPGGSQNSPPRPLCPRRFKLVKKSPWRSWRLGGSRPRPGGSQKSPPRFKLVKTVPTSRAAPGFTLVELLAVLAIMAIAAAVSLPAFVGLFRGNNQVQAINQVTADLTLARNLALQLHTDVALVFYEESANGFTLSGVTPTPPVHSGETAMAFAVALPGQPENSAAAPIWFEPYSGVPVQYLPKGTYVATLVGYIATAPPNYANGFYLPPTPAASAGNAPRAIVFNPNGHVTIINDLGAVKNPSLPTADYGDWNFTVTGAPGAGPSSPGVVVYEPNAMPQSALVNATALGTYLAANADVLTVNSYTGSIVP